MKSRQRVSTKRKIYGFIHLAGSFRRKMVLDKVDIYSAQAAFYLIMSLIPMLMIMFTILRYTPLTQEMILDTLEEFLMDDAMERVRGIVGNVYNGSITLLSFVAVSLFWVAGKGVMGLINGLNNINHLRESRNYVWLRLRSSIYTVLLMAAFVIAAGALVLGEKLRSRVYALLPFSFQISGRFSNVIRAAAGMALMILIFNSLYVFLPDRKKKFRSQLYGSVFTAISWAVFSFFFSLYLRYAKNLSIIYGGLLTIVMIMLWTYFCIYLFFLGAEINAWKENPDILPY